MHSTFRQHFTGLKTLLSACKSAQTGSDKGGQEPTLDHYEINEAMTIKLMYSETVHSTASKGTMKLFHAKLLSPAEQIEKVWDLDFLAHLLGICDQPVDPGDFAFSCYMTNLGKTGGGVHVVQCLQGAGDTINCRSGAL